MGTRVGQQLRELRLASGRTQAEIAAEIGVSRATVAQIELGNRALKVAETEKVARAYGTEPSRLLGPTSRAPGPDEVLDALIERVPSLGELERELGEVVTACRALTEMEGLLAVNAYAAPPPVRALSMPGSAWEAVHQGYETAVEERRRLNLGDGPIRDVDETLAIASVRATKLPLPDGVASLMLSSPEHGLVVLANAGLPVEERRFQYAHAYAHLLFDRAAESCACQRKDAESLPEIRASAFASRFLVPEQGLKRYLRSLGKDTLARAGGTRLQIYSERKTDSLADRRVSVTGRDRHGATPCGVVEIELIAGFFGVSPLLICHVLRDLGLVPRSELDELAGEIARGSTHPVRGALDLRTWPAPSNNRDPFRTRLVVLATRARSEGLIAQERLDGILDAMQVPPSDRRALLRGVTGKGTRGSNRSSRGS